MVDMAASVESPSNTEGASYLSQLLQEQGRIPLQSMPHTARLLQQEIDHAWRRENETDSDSTKTLQPVPVLEIHTGKPLRLKVKVHIPVKDHPNFNFVGKLLGPKGNSLKQLQEVTQTKMAILGRGSMRDKQKEEELRSQDDPKYNHLKEDLHVEITAFAPPAEAYQRIAMALTEVKRFLVPDYFDDIRQQQLRELGVLGGNKSKHKTAESSSSQGSPVFEIDDPSVTVETGSPTVSSAIKRHQHPHTLKGYANSIKDYQEHCATDSPYRTVPGRYFEQKMCNGICSNGDFPSTNHDYMYENSVLSECGNNYPQEENTTSGNSAYVDEIDITNTFEEINDEQCVPPRRVFPTAPASRSSTIFRSAKFRSHPYNSHQRYQ